MLFELRIQKANALYYSVAMYNTRLKKLLEISLFFQNFNQNLNSQCQLSRLKLTKSVNWEKELREVCVVHATVIIEEI